MGIIEIILVGLVVGALARLLVPGYQPLGFLGTLAIGVGGSLLGWWLARALFDSTRYSWLWAVGGAVLLILAWEAIANRRSAIHR